MSDCLIGLGSNVDDRLGNIRNSLNSMTVFFRLCKVSSVWETEPVGYPHQGWFFNIVVRGAFDGDPEELLNLIMKIQDKAGNDKKHKNAPRKVDVDILTFDDFVHPVTGDTIDKLIENCSDESIVKHCGQL